MQFFQYSIGLSMYLFFNLTEMLNPDIEVVRNGCLFYVTHTAQLWPMLDAVIVAPQQAIADTGCVYIMATAALHLAFRVQQVFEDSCSN